MNFSTASSPWPCRACATSAVSRGARLTAAATLQRRRERAVKQTVKLNDVQQRRIDEAKELVENAIDIISIEEEADPDEYDDNDDDDDDEAETISSEDRDRSRTLRSL